MTLEEIKAAYPYLYETHMHTSEGSKCATSTGEEQARAYKENGYAGIIVTDHNWGGNTAVDRSLPYEEWIDTFFKGYENAKAEGEKIGLQVFLGMEAGFNGQELLCYGFTIPKMKEHPELWTASAKETTDIMHDMGAIVVQPHPFREAFYIKNIITFEDFVDGIEIINASHSNPHDGSRDKCVYDERAIKLALDNNLPGTAGSDQHSTHAFGGGVAFPTPLKDINDYINRIINREDYVLTNGRQWFTKEGKLLLTCVE